MKRLRKFRPNYLFTGILTAVIFFTVTWKTAAIRVPPKYFGSPLTALITDTVPTRPPIDSNATRAVADTSKKPLPDSIRQRVDTFSLKLSKDSLDAPVKYEAEDSVVVLIKEKKIILHGKTKTDYKDISLAAPKVEIDQTTQIATAFNAKDSFGNVLERATFRQGDNSFMSDTIQFNFKTQKGLTTNTYTDQGEIIVIGDKSKKVDANTTFIKGARFTTCKLDDPHFAFRTNKMKVISEKVAVSGPTHPEFEGVPVPIYLPFGLFPLSQKRHSGLLPPQFTTNEQMGLGLEGLGYYKVLSDYWDAKIYGNIYSYGSWSINLNPTYRKRYRYNGAFNISVQNTRQNFKGDPDFFVNRSYNVTWGHTVDSRARPGVNFSANVNAGSTQYNSLIPNNPQENFRNQLYSSISYSKTWKGTPFNLTLNANHNQNNQTRLINVSLPDAGFTMSTIYPLQRKNFVGAQRWYEKLGIGYNGVFRNQFSFYDTAFSLERLIDTLQWGAQHNIPISVSLPPIMGGAVIVSPSVSYSQVWIAQKMYVQWNNTTQKRDTTVIKGFFTDHSTSFSLGLNTAVFGTYQFGGKGRLQALRHVIRPSFSFNYKPDLSKEHFYWSKINAAGDSVRLSEFMGSLYPGYSEGRSGGISFAIDNNLEMKLRAKDTTGEQKNVKVRLIDGFGLGSGYNFLADSMKLLPFNLYFRTNLLDKINISASANMSPYKTNAQGREYDEYVWQGGKFSLGRVTSGNISISTSFKSKPKDPEKEARRQKELTEALNDPQLMGDQQRLLEYMRQNPSEFVDFNIPWQVSISYALSFYERIKSDYSGFEKEFSSNVNFNGSFSLTPKWNFSVNGFYDFDTKALQQLSMSISREMHCWQMSINIAPVGLYRFFNITISPKASILQDLRINRTRSFTSM
jgi:LPS-assembly protein